MCSPWKEWKKSKSKKSVFTDLKLLLQAKKAKRHRNSYAFKKYHVHVDKVSQTRSVCCVIAWLKTGVLEPGQSLLSCILSCDEDSYKDSPCPQSPCWLGQRFKSCSWYLHIFYFPMPDPVSPVSAVPSLLLQSLSPALTLVSTAPRSWNHTHFSNSFSGHPAQVSLGSCLT